MRAFRSSSWPLLLGAFTFAGCSREAPNFATTTLDPRLAPPDSTQDSDVSSQPEFELPLDRRAVLELVQEFLSALEQATPPRGALLDPEARVLATQTGRSRLLSQELGEFFEAQTNSVLHPQPRLRFARERLVTRPDTTQQNRSRSLGVSVPLRHDPLTRRNSSAEWFVIVQLTSRGLRIIEVQTPDGKLS